MAVDAIGCGMFRGRVRERRRSTVRATTLACRAHNVSSLPQPVDREMAAGIGRGFRGRVPGGGVGAVGK